MQYQRSTKKGRGLRRRNKSKSVILLLVVIIVSLLVVAVVRSHNNSSSAASSSTSTRKKTTKPTAPVGFDKKQLSIDTADSLWVVVNKKRPLNPINYVPANLIAPNVPLRLTAATPEMQMRSDAAHALETMFTSAKGQNIQLDLQSGYRPYTEQVTLYNSYVKSEGQTVADQQSARAGHSEHQTGLAVDVGTVSGRCEVDPCFATTPEGQWVAANSYKYGFIVRYLDGKQSITGYEYEPWHLRYVGIPLATELHKTGQTLEEFFNLPAAPSY